jgi:hypothetical protein
MQETTEMPALSATTLKLFQECPRCFWLHVNQKLERPRGPFPSLPTGMDRVLKVYFDGYRNKDLLPPLIEGRLPGKLSTAALTLGFNDAAAHARLWGKLDDCVVFPDGRLAPLDHKTRASPPPDIEYTLKYYKFQMDVYALLLERNGYPVSPDAYLVYYSPREGVLHQGFPFEVTVHRVTTEPHAAYEIFAGGSRCLSGALPKPSETCAYCRWLQRRSQGVDTPAPEPQAQETSIKRASSRQVKIKQAQNDPSEFREDLFA